MLTRAHRSWLARLVVAVLCVTGGGLGVVASGARANVLPDGRVFELVSPVEQGLDWSALVPIVYTEGLESHDEHGSPSSLPFQPASNGEAVVYPGFPLSTGGTGSIPIVGEGNEFIARRRPSGGWEQSDLQPLGRVGALYEAFSSDLSVSVLNSLEQLVADAPGKLDKDFYLHATADDAEGEYQPFFTGTPTGWSKYKTVVPSDLYAGANAGANGVPAFSHVLFQYSDPLTANAGFNGSTEEEVNLYDDVDGELYLVNVLPGGGTDPNAVFGSKAGQYGHVPDASHVISADGSRIFWTDLTTGDLYVRVNDTQPESPMIAGKCTVSADACSVLVSEGGSFWTASPDGSKVIFTKGDLYEYDVEDGQTTDLTPGIEVKGLLGESENDEYIYYADTSNRVYVWHEGTSKYITTLSALDDEKVKPYAVDAGGDLSPFIGTHTAYVIPDGRSLVFMSNMSLTGYGNEGLDEVFLYEAGSGKLTCVSCSPTDEAPIQTELPERLGSFIRIDGIARDDLGDATYQPQAVSDDGSKVFFDSAQPLVPQDTNGLVDVYEWERDGSGSCAESAGCIYLLSGGTDPESSYLIGIGATGHDVFIVSRAQLTGKYLGEGDLVYDAREDGVQTVESTCTGTGCQGLPAPPPIFATPASVTFNGVGNFSPPPAVQTEPKAVSLTVVQKLASALRTCRAKKRSAHKREVCEAAARNRYGSKAKKSNRRGK